MNKNFARLSAIAALAALAGCQTFPVGQYAPSEANREALQKLGTAKIGVKDFTALKPGVTKISCRGAGDLTFPTGESAEQYLSNALRRDLTYAGLYANGAPLTIGGTVNRFDMNSNVLNAGWDFDITLTKGAEELHIQYLHRVKTAWMADRACAAVAAQLVEATQALNQQIIGNPKFQDWLKTP